MGELNGGIAQPPRNRLSNEPRRPTSEKHVAETPVSEVLHPISGESDACGQEGPGTEVLPIEETKMDTVDFCAR